MRVTIHRLANGLTVYLSPNRIEPRITALITVRAGSKADPEEATGIAHYLEHMLFKGTAQLGSMDYEREKPHLDRIVELYDRRFKTKNHAERDRLDAEIDAENVAAARYEIPNELDRLYRQIGGQGLNAYTSENRPCMSRISAQPTGGLGAGGVRVFRSSRFPALRDRIGDRFRRKKSRDG